MPDGAPVIDALALIEERLHSAGKKVKRSGDKLNAQCPAHDDNNPSFSATYGSQRDIVMHCFAGCKPENILRSLNIKWTDFGDSNPKQSPLTTWIYRDADGHPIYRVVKYPNKQFRQHAYDANTGEWLQKLGNTQRVPYRLPEIITAINNGDTIYIAEGEKDVDALVNAGVVATCNSGGAGKFTDEIAAHFVGARRIVIIADNDETGREHAADVAAKLQRLGATVEVMRAVEGKDAYDHFTFGHGIDEFVPLKDTDVVAEQTTDDDDAELLGMLIDWDAFWTTDHQAEEWLWEPVIAAKRATALFAAGGVGKSLIVLRMVIDLVAKGITVLYLDYEMTPDDLYDRLSEMGVDESVDLSRLRYAQLPSLPAFDTPDGGKAVNRMADLVGADIVIIDTFARAVEGDENDADTVRQFYRMTGLHLKAAGRAFVRIDHAGKDVAKGQRGSSAKNDDVDVVWRLDRTEDGYKLLAKKRRMGWVPETVNLERHDGPFRLSIKGGNSWPAGTSELAKVLDELDVNPDWGERKVRPILRDAGHRTENAVLRAAIKHRRERSESFHFIGEIAATESETTAPESVRRTSGAAVSGAPSGAVAENDTNTQLDGFRRSVRRSAAHPSDVSAAQCAPPMGAQSATREPEPALSDFEDETTTPNLANYDDLGWGMFD